jgi:Nif-specific regulatory protein
MTRIKLEVLRQGKPFLLAEPDGDVVRMGRGGGCDVRIDDPTVALEHAQLLVEDDQVVLVELGAGTPTAFRRGATRTVLGDAAPTAVIQADDVIELGGAGGSIPPVEIRVRFETDPEPPRVFEVRSLAELPGGPAAPDRGGAVLRTLCDLQRHIGAAADLAAVLCAVADAALVLVPRGTHATVILRDEVAGGAGDGAFVPVLTRVRDPSGRGTTPNEPVRVARSVFRKVVRDRVAILAADAPAGELSTESLLGASIRSTIGVPLWLRDEILGVLQIDNRAAPAMFTSADVDAVAVLAANASLAVANARLISKLERTEEQLARENRFLKGRERARSGGATEVIGKSAAFTALVAQIAKVADTRVSVLVEGETGSGKELVAAALHYRSRRQDRLFVAQNCAALPETLLESELFGHKRGAFTGATEDRKGLFELADGGTLFLDEVTEMPLGLQAKLLRVLQEKEVRPVGATHPKHVDVRIVAATNRTMEREVAEGRFREDLYYRLNVFPLRVPPLRERHGDVPLLAGHFLARYAGDMGKSVAGYSEAAMTLMTAYEWPGNVRELENEVQRLVIEVDTGASVTPDLLSAKIRRAEGVLAGARVPRQGAPLKDMVDQVERHLVSEALRAHGNNKTRAAKALGITREGLHKKLKHLGID